MKKPYLIILLMTLLIAGVQWYKSSANICPAPIYYKLGNVDESFALSDEKAKEYINSAVALWEDSANRDLFVYKDSAEFTVNFVFDERQEAANSEVTQRERLDQKRDENEKVLETVEALQVQYKELSENYKKRLADYESDLEAHNQEVNKYNNRGGAPADVFQTLEKARVALNEESEDLSYVVEQLNNLAGKINKLSDSGDELVDDYNRDVERYNEEFGYSREFTQGDYQGDEINIYKYSTGEELITVLAHEFGHALGIDHVEDSSSLMHYLIDDENTKSILSDNDIVAYKTVCGTEETTGQKIRRMIRDFINQ